MIFVSQIENNHRNNHKCQGDLPYILGHDKIQKKKTVSFITVSEEYCINSGYHFLSSKKVAPAK